MHFFRLADDDTDESMSTALLRCLFKNLMYYQFSDKAGAFASSLAPPIAASEVAHVNLADGVPLTFSVSPGAVLYFAPDITATSQRVTAQRARSWPRS